MFENRWYDKHPKVSAAVGCIENANEELQKKIANLIIKHASRIGIEPQKPRLGLFRRWYDKDKDLSQAMEYFKNCDRHQRIAIAEHIISYIREMPATEIT